MSEIVFKNANLIRSDGTEVLQHINWHVRASECWAIVGPTASGKTTLLEAIHGKHRLTVGERQIPEAGVRFVAFQEESRLFSYSGYYYQQRYEFADTDNPLSLAKFLMTGREVSPTRLETIAKQFGIYEQLGQPFVTLSNGQTRRARLARALLETPSWLLLDGPFLGLDATGRGELTELFQRLAAAGQGLILATQPEWLPNSFGSILELNFGRATTRKRIEVSSSARPVHRVAPLAAERLTPVVLEMTNVSVRHAGKPILNGINWTVRQGERWAIIGPNGAGKTTLLALACGDHPQAFSNDVKLFGMRRGSGETIWDIKRRIGFVSPEFHLGFREPLTGLEAAATAFSDSLLYRPPSDFQQMALRETFAAFGCEELMPRHFRRMSVGQQRPVLLVRAVVKQPELLVLDEPFQGLDPTTANRIRDWLDQRLQPTQTLLFVTHVPSQLPRTLTHELVLNRGQVATALHPAPIEPSASGLTV